MDERASKYFPVALRSPSSIEVGCGYDILSRYADDADMELSFVDPVSENRIDAIDGFGSAKASASSNTKSWR